MNMVKGDSIYTGTESRGKWKVSKDSGMLVLSVDVPKELCKTGTDYMGYGYRPKIKGNDKDIEVVTDISRIIAFFILIHLPYVIPTFNSFSFQFQITLTQ